MDIQESLSYKIPAFGQHVVGVLLNPSNLDGELIPLSNGLPSEGVQAAYRARGLCFVGTLGFIEGKFRSAFERPLSDAAVDRISRAYCEFIYKTLVTEAPTKTATDEAVDWLRKLYALPSEDR